MGLLTPGRYVHGVTSIDLPSLRHAGKRVLLLDRDNTLVPRDTHVAPRDVLTWLGQAHELGFTLCLVSNNWAKNVRPDAEAFDATFISRAAKPLPFALWLALRRLGATRREAVLVGDQVFTDVLGASLAGVDCILVQPQAEKDLAHTLALRHLEARVLRNVPLEDILDASSQATTSADKVS